MIIGDFNLECIAVTPYEADPELVIDPDAVLSGAVTLERFQAIAGENRKIREHGSGMNLDELSLNNRGTIRQPSRVNFRAASRYLIERQPETRTTVENQASSA